MKPRSGRRPLPMHRSLRGPEHFGDFRHGQSAEESQLHHSCHALIAVLQCRQRLFECEQFVGARVANEIAFAQRHAIEIAAALETRTLPRMLDEDSPHRLCRSTEEVRATLPLAATDETEIRFVDE